MTLFKKQVYAVVKTVPRGNVITYKEVAQRINNPRAHRAVGNALNKSPGMPLVPCHRVIKSNGSVGGYAHGTKKKIALLKQEGVIIRNGRIMLSE